MEKLSIKDAKIISLIKWETIKETKNDSDYKPILRHTYPEILLEKFYYCGFCCRHNFTYVHDEKTPCSKCEFAKAIGHSCVDDNSIYLKIMDRLDEEIFDEFFEESINLLIETIKNISENE